MKIGILGGGQLGKMLCLAAADWHLETFVLGKKGCSAENYCAHFIEGDFKNYEDVLNFGRLCDVITIEIEHVNLDALQKLEEEGIKVFPSEKNLRIIADKGLQKKFYDTFGFPSTNYILFENKKDLSGYLERGDLLPCVWKSCRDG